MGLPVAELNYVFNTYGPQGYWGLMRLATSKEYQNASDEEVFNAFVQCPTPTTSYFFRDISLRVTAEEVAPHIAPPDRPLEVRHVGGGRGKEAYSVGALLAGNGISFNSTSIDVNGDLLPPPGSIPTFSYHQDPAAHFNNKEAADRYVRPFFSVEQVNPKKGNSSRVTHVVTPKALLANHVGFEQHDLLTNPLSDSADIVLAQNIMYHYPWKTRDILLQHALGGMTKGVVVFEVSNNHKSIPDYKDWLASLDRFGLAPYKQLQGRASLAVLERIFSYDANDTDLALTNKKKHARPKVAGRKSRLQNTFDG